MIPYQNLVVIAGVVFFLFTKIVSFLFGSPKMYKKGALSSIPELDAEEDTGRKWVPKKKHEVLKAKYKCLKKLFQIYDASVIGILPEQSPEYVRNEDEARIDHYRRRKRSHRTKTDACAGTNEIAGGDNNSEYENSSVATAVIRELTIDQSCISTQMDLKIDKFAETIDTYTSEKNFDCNCHNNCQMHNCQNCHSSCQKERLFKESQIIQNLQPPIPYIGYERRKLTRFQCFVQRLFGIRKEAYKPEDEMYAASDPILTFKEKRRRRGLRFRRLKRAKKVRSESALRDFKNPSILSYVQSVQKHCLMDTTPRKCPIVGCNMISYGIINYNDHLNLCHFKDRKYICHYCHEGFETEYDKLMHENEHIGLSKFGGNMSTLSSVGKTYKIASNTQTEPESKIPEEKLKKIVSFFDKIADNEQIITEIKKTRSSETNMTSKDTGSSSGASVYLTSSSYYSSKDTGSSSGASVYLTSSSYCSSKYTGSSSGASVYLTPSSYYSSKDTGSSSGASERSGSDQTGTTCCTVRRKAENKPASSEGSNSLQRLDTLPPTCRYCGENFSCRRQMSLHVDSEHRARDRFTKHHSCAGIVHPRVDMTTEEGSINVQTATNSVSYCESLKRVDTSTTLGTASRKKSDESLTCDPSTNIVYYTSVESLENKPSVVDSLVQKVRSYRWEPGTKIIRV